MNRLTTSWMLGIVIALAPTVGVIASARASIEPPKPALRHGARSVEELVDRFLKALEASDREALRRLRVDKAEYLRVIIPGSARPGQPPKRFPSLLRRYAWDSLNSRCLYYESTFLNTLGGRTFTLDRFEFREGVKEYAGYTAHSQLGLFLRDDTGDVREVRTGSIAEVGGTYKFISFVRD